MARNIAVVVLLLFVVCNDKYIFGALIEPTRYNLIHYLLNDNGYDPTLPPDFYTDNATDVTVQMSIYDLNAISDFNMEYECTLYLRIKWTDSRLDFTANYTANGSSYDTLKVSSGNIKKVWIPDLYFHHERRAELHKLMDSNELIYIHRNGSIQFSSRVNIRSHCEMDLNRYPYDKQICPITIQSYAYTAEDIILHWGNPPVKITTNHLAADLDSSTSTFSPPNSDPVGNFSTLKTYITFTRASRSYEVMYIAPSVILSAVSLTSFLLADDSVSRVTVVTGSLTSLVMQWAGIYSKLPPVSELYRLDWWMLANMIFIGCVLVANAAIYQLKIFTKDKKKTDEASDKKKTDEASGHYENLPSIQEKSKKGDNENVPNSQEKSKKESFKQDPYAFVFFCVFYLILASVFILHCWK